MSCFTRGSLTYRSRDHVFNSLADVSLIENFFYSTSHVTTFNELCALTQSTNYPL